MLATEVVRRIACDASLVLILESGSGEPLDIGRKTRLIPPAIHRALRRRDAARQPRAALQASSPVAARRGLLRREGRVRFHLLPRRRGADPAQKRHAACCVGGSCEHIDRRTIGLVRRSAIQPANAESRTQSGTPSNSSSCPGVNNPSGPRGATGRCEHTLEFGEVRPQHPESHSAAGECRMQSLDNARARSASRRAASTVC
jgi:hypothetical protein